MQSNRMNRSQPDTFICHASEDKEAIARPIHKALTELRIYAWLDESEIRLGQSIRQKIDDGLASCRSATVILSSPFFSKNWTQYEMDGIVGRQMQREILLFPIQHGITIEEIRDNSPPLAGLSLWNSSDHSPAQIATEIARQLEAATRIPPEAPAAPTNEPYEGSVEPSGARAFGTFYIAPTGTEQLPPNVEPEVDTLLLFSNPTGLIGWTPVVESKEELEYVIEGKTLRVRLSWGSSWGGGEFLVAKMLSGEDPFALTIRRTSGQQVYLPTVINRSPATFLTAPSSRSGWMTFLIR